MIIIIIIIINYKYYYDDDYDDDDDDDHEDDDDNIYFYSAIFIAVLWRFTKTINFLKNKLTIMHCLNIFKKLCFKHMFKAFVVLRPKR